MKNCVLSAILLVGALVYSEAAPDLEAYNVPSSYRDGFKWQLGPASLHTQANAYRSAPAVPYVQPVQTGLYDPYHNQYGYRHATQNQVPVVHQPTYKYQQPAVFKHVQPVYQPIATPVKTAFKHVQYPVHQPVYAASAQHPVYKYAGGVNAYRTTGLQQAPCVHV